MKGSTRSGDLSRRPNGTVPAPADRYGCTSGQLIVSGSLGGPSVIRFDAIIVGGGPAGSACARVLVRAGLRVAVVDRRRFPRVKLCAGWISAPVWDVLELSRREYAGVGGRAP